MRILDLMPSDTPDYMAHAWVDCLGWAIGEPEIVQRFRDESGMRWTPGTSPIERMIDASTGADMAFIAAFVAWFNVNIWGAMTPPTEQSA